MDKKIEGGSQNGVGVWNTIKIERNFEVWILFKVGSWNEIKFWNNRWCGNSSLRDASPNLYAIASSKELG